MKRLRLGVIGVGGRGGLAFYAHKPESGVELAGGADIDEAALEMFADTYGPNVFVTTDYRELLGRGLDAVFITSPDPFHEEHAAAALSAGAGVYLEMPLAGSVEGCDRVLRAAMTGGAKLYIGHTLRHTDFLVKMRELIDHGAIGEVQAAWCRHFISYGGDAYFKDWRAERRNVNSLLLHAGCHDIDALHWLCGGHAVRVNALGGLSVYGRVKARRDPAARADTSWNAEHWPPLRQRGLNPALDVEDQAMMQMLLGNGVLCSYQQCTFAPDGWRNYTVIGTEGRIENFGNDPDYTTIRVWNTRHNYYNPMGDADYVIPHVKSEIGMADSGGADPAMIAEFIAWLRGGSPPSVGPLEARASVAAACMATESMRNGGTARAVPPPPPDIAAYFAR